MNEKTPEYYGYKIGENIAPYINKCIYYHGECYISEGVHVLGRNDRSWELGNVWTDSAIVWGWNRTSNVKLIGAGKDKTILKWIDNCHAAYLHDIAKDLVVMVTTNWDLSCDNNLIEGITFDGNYENNRNTATQLGIRIRGENNTVKNCKFINFGVGSRETHECFQIIIGPKDSSGKGTQVIDNYFSLPGKKINSTDNHVPEITVVAVGGDGASVKGNVFENMEFDIDKQQSPLHAISLGISKNAEISENKFINFQGACIYMDSWTNENFVIKNNISKNVWQFLQLTCQNWDNPQQISFNKDALIINNDVELSIGNCYYHWSKPAFVSNFCGYVNAPNVDHDKYPGFKNILITKNNIKLGYRKIRDSIYEESTKLFCYWGNSVGEDKIKMADNIFISCLPQPPKSFFRKILDFFIGLFK